MGFSSISRLLDTSIFFQMRDNYMVFPDDQVHIHQYFYRDEQREIYQYVFSLQYVFQMSGLIDINMFYPGEPIVTDQCVFPMNRLLNIYKVFFRLSDG